MIGYDPTTPAMVTTAEAAVAVAEEAVDAAGLLLAEALDGGRMDVQMCLAAYRRAKAERAYAVAVAESVAMDHADLGATRRLGSLFLSRFCLQYADMGNHTDVTTPLSDPVRPVTATAYEESLHFLEQAEAAVDRVENEWANHTPQSATARQWGQYGAHCRKMAEVHATLAVAEELHALRLMLGSLEQHSQAFSA